LEIQGAKQDLVKNDEPERGSFEQQMVILMKLFDIFIFFLQPLTCSSSAFNFWDGIFDQKAALVIIHRTRNF
jgi:hypothetical protein